MIYEIKGSREEFELIRRALVFYTDNQSFPKSWPARESVLADGMATAIDKLLEETA